MGHLYNTATCAIWPPAQFGHLHATHTIRPTQRIDREATLAALGAAVAEQLGVAAVVLAREGGGKKEPKLEALPPETPICAAERVFWGDPSERADGEGRRGLPRSEGGDGCAPSRPLRRWSLRCSMGHMCDVAACTILPPVKTWPHGAMWPPGGVAAVADGYSSGSVAAPSAITI